MDFLHFFAYKKNHFFLGIVANFFILYNNTTVDAGRLILLTGVILLRLPEPVEYILY